MIGAAGRMGTTVFTAVQEAPDLELVGRFDVGDDLGDLGGAGVDVDPPQRTHYRRCSLRGLDTSVVPGPFQDVVGTEQEVP